MYGIENSGENSPLLYTKIHLLCPWEVCHQSVKFRGVRTKFGIGFGNRNQGSILVSVLEPVFFFLKLKLSFQIFFYFFGGISLLKKIHNLMTLRLKVIVLTLQYILLLQNCGTMHEGIVLGTYLRRVFGKSTEGHGS